MPLALATLNLTDILGSTLFRGLAPILVCSIYELLVRYTSKEQDKALGRDGWFIALPLVGAAITAFPGLLALRAKSGEEVAAGSWGLVALVLVGWWLAVYDKDVLRGRRGSGGRLSGVFLATTVPNLLAAVCLGLVFAYAP
jgi:hypothetical protein